MSASTAAIPVTVIGAGPVGLAAAAHLAERGVDFVVLEAGDDVAAPIRQWPHVRLLSPWRYDTDPAVVALLEPTEWTMPDPTVVTGVSAMASSLDGAQHPHPRQDHPGRGREPGSGANSRRKQRP